MLPTRLATYALEAVDVHAASHHPPIGLASRGSPRSPREVPTKAWRRPRPLRLTLATFNVRCPMPSDGDQDWTHRRPLVLDLLRRLG